MWLKYLLLLSLLLCDVTLIHAASCDDWTFLCEHSDIFIDSSTDLKSIRMPLTSANCDIYGAAANCTSTFRARKGQKLTVKTGITFELGKTASSPCAANRHVQFESASESISKSDKKCGVYNTADVLFESVSEEMRVEYRSEFESDGAVIDVLAYGCSLEDEDISIIDGALVPTTMTFGPKDSEYEGLVTCSEGYLMAGDVQTKSTKCTSSQVPSSMRTRWDWQLPPEEFTCNRVTCGEITLPPNSKISLSNGLFYGSEAKFSCSEGYILEGDNSTMTCSVQSGVGGYWNGTAPQCNIIECGLPEIPNADFISPAVLSYQTRFSYSCSEGMTPFIGEATCNVNGVWDYTDCEATLCSTPIIGEDWVLLTTIPERLKVGTSLSLVCDYTEILVSIECHLSKSNDSKSAVWSEVPDCPKPQPPPAIERIEEVSKTSKSTGTVDKAGIIGGVIAGIVFAIVVMIIACIFVRKSAAKKKAALNNNEKIQLEKQREPLTGSRRNGSRKLTVEDIKLRPNTPDTEQDIADKDEAQLPAVLKHYRNRGNNRLRNGLSSGHSTIGTTSSQSHKSSESGRSVERLETGDLYDSVINGGITGGSNSRISSATSKKSMVSKESDGRSSASGGNDRKSVVSGQSNRKSIVSGDSQRRSTASGDSVSVENELDKSRLNGSVGPNKKRQQVNDASTFM